MTANQTVKLVIIGDGAVGKTCLLISYAQKRFPEDYVPTVFDNYVVTLTAGGTPINLSLWDTAGQEEYDRLRPLSYSNTNVFLICFSVVNDISYENVTAKWYPELVHFCPNTPFFLIGTQIDLRSDRECIDRLKEQGKRILMYRDGVDLAKKIRAEQYMECSAKTMEGVKPIFDEAIKSVVLEKKKKKKFNLRDRIKERDCVLL